MQNKNNDRLIESLDALSKKVGLLEKKPTTFEKFTHFISSWAQVLMLLVVIFGYVYTVIPVIQKEKISEELAHLELEKKSWDSDLAILNYHLKSLKDEIEELDSEKINLKSKLIGLKISEERLNTKSIEIKRELTYKNKVLLTINTQLTKATDELFEYQKRRLLGNEPVPNKYLEDLKGSYGINNDFKMAFDLNEKDLTLKTINIGSKLDPLKSGAIMLDELVELAENSEGVDKIVKLKIIKDYKLGLEENHASLVCPVINSDEWYTVFLASEKLIPRLTEKCSEITGASYCRYTVTKEIRGVLFDRWNELTGPCKERVLKLNQIVLGSMLENNLSRFIDVTAPSMAFIEQKVIETLKSQKKM